MTENSLIQLSLCQSIILAAVGIINKRLAFSCPLCVELSKLLFNKITYNVNF